MLVEIVGKRYEEKLITTSLKVAEVFEKEHKNVLRSIDNLVAEMDRDGFSLLVMGFTGEKALQWKIKYIEAFNQMESELKRLYTERQQWQIERDKGVVIRHILTDTIKMKITESQNKRFAYPNYTNLIYRNLFGKTAKELESDYGVKAKENLRDFFTGDDLAKVQNMEMLVSSLINCGWGYQQIKEFVQSEATKMIA